MSYCLAVAITDSMRSISARLSWCRPERGEGTASAHRGSSVAFVPHAPQKIDGFIPAIFIHPGFSSACLLCDFSAGLAAVRSRALETRLPTRSKLDGVTGLHVEDLDRRIAERLDVLLRRADEERIRAVVHRNRVLGLQHFASGPGCIFG